MKKLSLKKYLLGLVLACSMWVGFAFKEGDGNLFEIAKNIEIFTSMYRQINMYYVDDTKPGDLMRKGIDAMLSSLDPYTVYISEAQIEDYRFMTNRVYGGIGATIRQVDNKFYISEPYEGFPAAKADLKAGDQILKVDGESVAGLSTDQVSERLKGQAGTLVQLEIIPLGSTQAKNVSLNRENVKMKDVSYYQMMQDSIGYIKLDAFTETASAEVKTAVESFTKDNAKGLILDLRGNGGGLLRESVAIVNMFVPKGEMVVTTKSRIEEQNREHFALFQPLNEEIPLVVLVDNMSASASEIVSGALQDLDRAVIVGSTTYGKGLVQNTVDLSYNSKLKMTIAKYYIPSGRCIQKIDYSARDDYGVAQEVPDSVLKKFTTKGGRTVYDGRGISPDVEIEDEEAGRIIGGIFSKALFFKFANDYVIRHPELESPETFKLSAEEFAKFKESVKKAGIDYSTQSSAVLDKLKEVAKRELYYQDAAADFSAMEEKLAPNVNRDLEKFSGQIKTILENEIVSRYYWSEGRLRHSLADDPVLAKGMSYLTAQKQKEILTANVK